jgi:hypothetical protein
MPVYSYKFLEEMGWVALTATIIFTLQLATGLPENYSDWQLYLLPAGGGLVRAVAGAMLAAFIRSANYK